MIKNNKTLIKLANEWLDTQDKVTDIDNHDPTTIALNYIKWLKSIAECGYTIKERTDYIVIREGAIYMTTELKQAVDNESKARELEKAGYEVIRPA